MRLTHPPISDPHTPPPPEHLADAGVAFWRSITAEFVVDTADATATLAHAALALDRLAEARALLARDGLVLESGKANPAADLELKYLRAFRFATRELGLSVETEMYTRPPRPAGNRAAGRTD